jgi:hypothetical protein
MAFGKDTLELQETASADISRCRGYRKLIPRLGRGPRELAGRARWPPASDPVPASLTDVARRPPGCLTPWPGAGPLPQRDPAAGPACRIPGGQMPGESARARHADHVRARPAVSSPSRLAADRDPCCAGGSFGTVRNVMDTIRVSSVVLLPGRDGSAGDWRRRVARRRPGLFAEASPGAAVRLPGPLSAAGTQLRPPEPGTDLA